MTGRGATKREGVMLSFTPAKKSGGTSFSHAEEGGHKMFWSSFYIVARSFSHNGGKEAHKVSSL